MVDNTAPLAAGAGSIEFGGNVVSLSPIPLPVIYFDSAPSLSHMNGVIGVTLVVTGSVPTADGKIFQNASVVAHLKCNIPAAVQLRGALDSALLLAQSVANLDGKAH